jgi:hypothetical protein
MAELPKDPFPFGTPKDRPQQPAKKSKPSFPARVLAALALFSLILVVATGFAPSPNR